MASRTSIFLHTSERLLLGSDTDGANTANVRYKILAAVLLLISALLPLYLAWSMQHAAVMDATVPLIMSKHFAEGREFVPFYYGQAYMGSFESLLGSVFCRIFGVSAYAAYMGTTSLAMITPVLVFRLCRATGGIRAACIAMPLLWVHSATYCHYSIVPRGGYMALVVFGLLLLLAVTRCIKDLTKDGRQTGRVWISLFFAGLFAGLAWWSNQLSIVYLIAATLVVLPWSLRIVRNGSVFAGVIGFFLGSAPWWVWNAQNEWATFAFGQSFSSISVAQGWESLRAVVPLVLGCDPWPSTLQAIRLAIIFAFAAVSIRTLFTQESRERGVQGRVIFAAMLVSVGALGFIYLRSHFALLHATRYLFPLIPASVFFVALGAESFLMARRLRLIALVGLVVVLPPALLWIPHMHETLERDEERRATGRDLADTLNREGYSVVMAGPHKNPVAFYSMERLRIADFPMNFYAPYDREAAQAPQVFLDDFRAINYFLEVTDSQWRLRRLAGTKVIDAIKPPSGMGSELASQDSPTITIPGQNADLSKELHDRVLDNGWVGRLPADSDWTVECSFPTPNQLSSVRFPGIGNTVPDTLAVRVKYAEENTWTEIHPPGPITGWFWSAGRVMYRGASYELQRGFKKKKSIAAIRFVFRSEESHRFRLPEIIWHVPDVATAPLPRLDDLVHEISSLDVESLYAPRGLVDLLYDKVGDKVRLSPPSYLTREVEQLREIDSSEIDTVQGRGHVGFLVPEQRVETNISALKTKGLRIRESVTVDGWTILVAELPADHDLVENRWPLAWSEMGLFRLSGDPRAANRAVELLQRAKHVPSEPERKRILERVDELAPDLRKPPLPIARFQKGIDLVAVEATPTGSPNTVKITYTWRMDTHTNVRPLAVFVHVFQGDTLLTQDDHAFAEVLDQDAVLSQPYKMVRPVVRTLALPQGVPPADLAIKLGIVQPEAKERLKVTSPYRDSKKSIRFSFTAIQQGLSHNE